LRTQQNTYLKLDCLLVTIGCWPWRCCWFYWIFIFYFLFYVCNYYYMTLIITERKWRNHVECVLRKDICMRRSKAVISTCAQSSGDVGTTATRSWKHAGPTSASKTKRFGSPEKPTSIQGGAREIWYIGLATGQVRKPRSTQNACPPPTLVHHNPNIGRSSSI